MKTLIILVLFVSTFSISSQNTNWEPYYFEGINIWDFNPTGWNAELNYYAQPDSASVSFYRQIDEVEISFYNYGYSFAIKQVYTYNYKNHYGKLKKKYGQPNHKTQYNANWKIDSQRTVSLSWVEDECDATGIYIEFDWGNYTNTLLDSLFTETAIKQKELSEEEDRNYETAHRLRDYEQQEIEQKEEEEQRQEKIAKKEQEEKGRQEKEKKLLQRKNLTSDDFIGTWIYKGQIIDVLDIWSNGKCIYRDRVCYWSITEDKELEICGVYNCHYYLLEGNILILESEYMNGRKYPVSVSVKYKKAG